MGILFTAEVMYLSSKGASLLCGSTTQFDCLQPIWKKMKPSENANFSKKKKKHHNFKKCFIWKHFRPWEDFQKNLGVGNVCSAGQGCLEHSSRFLSSLDQPKRVPWTLGSCRLPSR